MNKDIIYIYIIYKYYITKNVLLVVDFLILRHKSVLLVVVEIP